MKGLIQKIKGSVEKTIDSIPTTFECRIKDFVTNHMAHIEEDIPEFMLIGLRNKEGLKSDVINDLLGFMHHGSVMLFRGTTDPGVYWTTSSERNNQGTFHLKNKFHKNIWCLGKHKGYEAFVNDWRYCLPTEGWRDANYNFLFDAGDIMVRGHFGINFHRMHPVSIVNKIGKYSGGCQVVNKAEDFKTILEAFKGTQTFKSNKKAAVSYLLLDIYKDLPDYLAKEAISV